VLLAQSFDLARRTLSGEPITVADSVAVEPITGSGAFSTSDAGVLTYRAAHPLVTRLSWFDRAGNSLGTFGSAEQLGLSNLRLSPDGRRVIAERTLRGETDLWMLDSTRQTRFTLGATALSRDSRPGRRMAIESRSNGRLRRGETCGQIREWRWWRRDVVRITAGQDSATGRRTVGISLPSRTQRRHRSLLPTETRAIPVSPDRCQRVWGQFSWTDAGGLSMNETGRYEIYVRPFRYKVARFHERRWRLSKMVAMGKSSTSSHPTPADGCADEHIGDDG
jgi:hypothetical protein